MKIKNKNVMVTGAAGFIGSNLIDMLLENEIFTIGLDNLYNGKLENLSKALTNDNFVFEKGDIRDYEFIFRLMEDVDIVFHEAAIANVPRTIEMPFSTNEVNVTGTLNVLAAAKNSNVKRVIFASSSAVYGETPILPKKEDMLEAPISPYGVSKLTGEKYCYAFYKVYGLETVSLRYFNVYGPRQLDSPYSGVIPIFISRVLNGKSPIIYGDGEQTRDFTYVEDVLNGNFLAAIKKSAVGQVFNLGTGNQTSIIDLANKIIQLCKKKEIDLEFAQPRPGDILNSQADISKAKKLLGYVPKYNLDKGLLKMTVWFKENRSDKSHRQRRPNCS